MGTSLALFNNLRAGPSASYYKSAVTTRCWTESKLCNGYILRMLSFLDMFLNEEASSTVLRTWIGQPVTFYCYIKLKVGADSPSFRWKNVEKNLTITENISSTRVTSQLKVTPQSRSDFGSYKCYARTSHTYIKHNMTLLEVGMLGLGENECYAGIALSQLIIYCQTQCDILAFADHANLEGTYFFRI